MLLILYKKRGDTLLTQIIDYTVSLLLVSAQQMTFNQRLRSCVTLQVLPEIIEYHFFFTARVHFFAALSLVIISLTRKKKLYSLLFYLSGLFSQGKTIFYLIVSCFVSASNDILFFTWTHGIFQDLFSHPHFNSD